jgi:hypothetical protein
MVLQRWVAITSLAALGAIAVAPPAFAGEPTAEEKAGARAAATQGNTAYKEKRYAEALDLFARAEALVHAPTHLLMIARTHVALGQLVRGREKYLDLAREVIPDAAPPAFKTAQVDGKRELEELEPRIPQVNVSLADPKAQNVTITMDGKPVPPALVGIPRPVDPGQHVFQARGQRESSDEKSVVIKEKERVSVVLELKPNGPGAAATVTSSLGDTPATTGAPEPPPRADTPDQPVSPSSGGNGMKYAGYAGIGLGVVGVGVGVAFTVIAASTRGEATDAYDACGGDACPEGSAEAQAVKALDDDADGQQLIGIIGFAGGAVLAGAGVALLVMSSKRDDKPAAAHVEPWIGLGFAGARGTF